MLEGEAQEVLEVLVGLVQQEGVLGRTRERRVLTARLVIETLETIAVELLQADDRPGELTLRLAEGALDANAPAKLGVSVEGDEVGEVVVRRAVTVGERAARVNRRGLQRECAEQQVDRLGDLCLDRTRIRVLGRTGDQ